MTCERLRFPTSASIIAYMNEAFHLARLQKMDTQVDQINARLVEIQTILANDQEATAAQAAADSAANQQAAARKALKAAEEAVQAQRMKIELNQAALYGGRVRNPKELQDLQNESAALIRHLAVLEDKQLETMLALEECDQSAAVTAAALTRAQANFATRSAALVGEQSQLQRDRERLQAERVPAAGQLSSEYLDIYERLRAKKRGVAVAGIDEYCCTACGTELPPADWQAARSPNKVTYCSSCGRILYAG